MTPTASEPASEMAWLHGLIHDRLTQLWAARQMYRSIGPAWTPGRHAVEVELRALLTLARKARREAATEPDSMTLAKGYRDWTEAEMAYASGR